MRANQVAIYGAGGFGREVVWLAQSIAERGTRSRVACFIDDNPAVVGTVFNDIRVLSLAEAHRRYPNAKIVSGIGVPRLRQITMEKAADLGFSFAVLIHPRVEMSKWIEIGPGTVICAGNVMTTNIVLGRHVQLNLDCTVGHDVRMADYATLAPGVHVSGYVHIGRRAYIGTGATIINGTKDEPIEIGDEAVIGAGACVVRSVPAGETWVGVPARPLCVKEKTADDGKRKEGTAHG
jgi:sugar O-acyltransferase (sialic acid O-acetyltransferase NeuD family)